MHFLKKTEKTETSLFFRDNIDFREKRSNIDLCAYTGIMKVRADFHVAQAQGLEHYERTSP
jgi:hypothetical protein